MYFELKSYSVLYDSINRKEYVIKDFLRELKYGTQENAKKYFTKKIKKANIDELKEILKEELNVSYLKCYYYNKEYIRQSILVINEYKQNEIVHFYLKREETDVSNYKIYKIEKE